MQQETGTFGNNEGKEPQRKRPKLKNMYITYLLRIFALLAIQCKWYYFSKYINFVEQRFTSSHFEGSI